MALVDDLISEIPDTRLRARLQTEANALRQRGQFGLTFERHSPETLIMPGATLRKGVRVALRDAPTRTSLTLKSIEGGDAVCVADGEQATRRLPISSLVVVKRDGEAVFPSLKPIAAVHNGGDDSHHLVIESENHSALQMLRWLYSGKVDCIYIDPPYNTGAKVWKYNNDYVDKNDSYLASKWLSMMERRLEIAKDLLAPDGILIIAIDDYEFAHLSTLLVSCPIYNLTKRDDLT